MLTWMSKPWRAKIPRLPNLSPVIVLRSHEWICLRQENDLSASALPTARIQSSSRMFGKKIGSASSLRSQVANYQYSTATLSYRSLSNWYLKCTLSCRLAALQHIPCLHSAFDGNRASLQHQQHRLMSLNRLCVLFLFPVQFRYS